MEGKMNILSASILAAFILVTLPLNLQAECNCTEPDGEPYVPYGNCEDEYEMEYSRVEISSYLDVIQAYTQCMDECINEANSRAEKIINKWNSAVLKYNLSCE
jgi:hypothetical protein